MSGQTTTRPVPPPPRPDGPRHRATPDRFGAGARVVTGEPGCGRTRFLDRAARTFTAGPVAHVRADPARSAVPYSGLRSLLHTLGDPTAGMRRGLLETLRAVAARAPLLVCVDDAHLWDAPSRAALGRAAAQLCASTDVRLLLTVPGHRPLGREFARLPVRQLDPLSPAEAADLLDEVTRGDVDGGVRDDLVDAAEGNPALLFALVRRLSPAQVRGDRPLPRPLADAGVLTGLVGRHLSGLTPEQHDVLLTVAAAARDDEDAPADVDTVLRAVGRLRDGGSPSLPDLLMSADGAVRFRSELLRRAVYAGAPHERRRAVHRALAHALEDEGGPALRVLLHRSWSRAEPGPGPAAELALAAAEAGGPARRCAAYTRAAELADGARERAEHRTAAAEQALLAGRAHRARRLLDAARAGSAPPDVRGRAELLRGTVALHDGPVDEAQASLLLAASLLAGRDPAAAGAAALGAFDAAWAGGDPAGCRGALDRCGEVAGPRPRTVHDYRLGAHALLAGHVARAARSLRHVIEPAAEADAPEEALRAATAALMLGDVDAARHSAARALAAARTHAAATIVPRAREYLAYAELRAGRHAVARAHAEEGLRAAHRAGQRNTAAHHHAVLALAASIEGESGLVAAHADAALRTARRHGLAQAATLAEWAAARADLAHGRPREAAERLGPLVGPGPRRGHFAVWMLAVPCFVEAAVRAGRPDGARTAVADLARWAGLGADPHAPAQLLRCQALLAPPDRADALYRRALDRHDSAGGDFERARTELLHGRWLRRRRRLSEARDRLGAALVGFERCGARPWADQARDELRANGVSAAGPRGRAAAAHHVPFGLTAPPALSVLTPQQLRIARCVAEGATNREVALTLSVSTRTVDYHLRKVFATLGVRSRVELARLVQQAERTGAHP
ncbi:LuxR C-terminal-related transcriptional regulator [Streptomyces sp. A012304]|uniref:LuxR C-terminal-related transcriptional regulator n=1 Tax=Streptomyces sp. A012304 TaxID=375446 RepID=UPI002232B1CF|nr:LuxR C-terminal-related transcriptional regulator [Streptomyces sp. A012304]GKQ34954.1 helix-turn-helix transcriptional regulator [Streptomyces sp. A012304]